MNIKRLSLCLILSLPAHTGLASESCDSIIQSQNDRLEALPNGLVVDTVTGLTWFRCSYSQTWDTTTEQCVGDIVNDTWFDAISKIEASEAAGISDWRMPNMKEMASIVAFGCNPAINQFVFSVSDGSRKAAWTSQVAARVPENAWYFSLGKEGILFHGKRNDKDFGGYAYMVRGDSDLFFPVEGDATHWQNVVGSSEHIAQSITNGAFGPEFDSILVDDTFALDLNLGQNEEQNMWAISTQAGTVTKRFDNLGFILIRHSSTLTIETELGIHREISPWFSGSMHLRDLQVEEDDVLASGDRLGRISDVGTGAIHLHFAVYEQDLTTGRYNSIDVSNKLDASAFAPLATHFYWCDVSPACSVAEHWWQLDVAPCDIPESQVCP